MTGYLSRALLPTKPDTVLVALARGGSDAAFSAIVDRYRRSLHRQCRALLPDHQAEDAVQQTFVRALQALRSGVEVRELRPWLYRIARNVALTELAARGSGHDVLDEAFEDCGRSGEVDRRAELRAALTAMASLPDRERTALVRAAGGESHAAIAQELGVSEAGARQILHRARATLRAAVQAVIPPPVFWLARRVGALAERLPSQPASVEPFVPKLAAVIAAAAAVAAPASLMHARWEGSRHPVDSGAAVRRSPTANRMPIGVNPLQPPSTTWPPSALAPSGAHLAARAHGGGGSASAPSAGTPPARRGAAAASTSSSASAPASASVAATTSVPATVDPNSSYPTSTDPTSTDPTSTDPTSTDPTSTDPTSTDPTSTDPTSTDPTSTDPTSTAPTLSSP